MSISGLTAASISLLLLTLPVSTAALEEPNNFWDSAVYDPAPPPEQGPPAAFYATRDKSLLPAQICGIVGGYVAFVAIVLALQQTWGKRMRRKAQSSPNSLEIEMVKSHPRIYDTTPVSPASTTRSWFKSQFSRREEPSVYSTADQPVSPGMASIASFDRVVLESDKESRQREMERLYAAVMEHDSKHDTKSVKSAYHLEEAEIQPVVPVGRQEKGAAAAPNTASPRKQRNLPYINTHLPSGENGRRLDVPAPNYSYPTSPISPTSPRSPMRAIYPPDSPLQARYTPHAAPPLYPPRVQEAEVGADHHHHHHHHPHQQPAHGDRPTTPRSTLRKSRTSSIGSNSSKSARKGIRNLRISGPIPQPHSQKYPGGPADDDEARTPLSPRFYANVPPPPTPPAGRSTAPGTPGTIGDEEYRTERRDMPQPLPLTRPGAGYASRRGGSGGSGGSSRGAPGPLTLQMPENGGLPPPPVPPGSAARTPGSSTSTLPLRAYADQVGPLPSTKTTFLDRRRDGLMNSNALRTPRTGVPATPYSAYMPFTPITPVTPHLVTRRERKQMEKEMGRRIQDESDLVKEEGDLWDSGY